MRDAAIVLGPEFDGIKPVARAELEGFLVHLRDHPRGISFDGCRFCAVRVQTPTPRGTP